MGNRLSTPSKNSPKRRYAPSRKEAIAELARRRLIDFSILTRKGYIPNWHHYIIAEKLEAVERGEITRLAIFMPPRHGKTELASIRFPAWCVGRNPEKHIIAASYSGDLATDFGRQVRNLVADELYVELFSKILSDDSTAADRWNTVKNGRYVSAGVGGPIVGRGADILLIDDPIKDYEEAHSAVIRQKVWDWYTTVALTRLHQNGAIILIETRWHEDDLAGRILRSAKETGEHWDIISFPAIAEEDEEHRKKGEALWPGMKSIAELEQIRATQGSVKWSSLYQQKPPKEQGAIFKREWFPRYKGEPYGVLVRRSQVLDTAHKTKKENDYSSLITFDTMNGGNIYVRHVWREKVIYPDLKRKVADLFASHKSHELCVEDKDAGAMLIQEFQRDTKLPVIPIQADKDKVLRAHAATPLCEAGKVYLPEDAPWLEAFLDELMSFPSGENDDQVDAFVHGINRLKDIADSAVPEPKEMTVDTGFRSIGTMLEMPI